jgi:hypothetical protein
MLDENLTGSFRGGGEEEEEEEEERSKWNKSGLEESGQQVLL